MNDDLWALIDSKFVSMGLIFFSLKAPFDLPLLYQLKQKQLEKLVDSSFCWDLPESPQNSSLSEEPISWNNSFFVEVLHDLDGNCNFHITKFFKTENISKICQNLAKKLQTKDLETQTYTIRYENFKYTLYENRN